MAVMTWSEIDVVQFIAEYERDLKRFELAGVTV